MRGIKKAKSTFEKYCPIQDDLEIIYSENKSILNNNNYLYG
jgi:hypothetical protein